jgi:hypothetical protein
MYIYTYRYIGDYHVVYNAWKIQYIPHINEVQYGSYPLPGMRPQVEVQMSPIKMDFRIALNIHKWFCSHRNWSVHGLLYQIISPDAVHIPLIHLLAVSGLYPSYRWAISHINLSYQSYLFGCISHWIQGSNVSLSLYILNMHISW